MLIGYLKTEELFFQTLIVTSYLNYDNNNVKAVCQIITPDCLIGRTEFLITCYTCNYRSIVLQQINCYP